MVLNLIIFEYVNKNVSNSCHKYLKDYNLECPCNFFHLNFLVTFLLLIIIIIILKKKKIYKYILIYNKNKSYNFFHNNSINLTNNYDYN